MAIQSIISDFAYFDSEEQVDIISDSKQQVNGISDSNKKIDTKREAKAYKEYIFRN